MYFYSDYALIICLSLMLTFHISVTGFKSDVTVPIVDSEESMVRTDSYEEFNKVSELAVDGKLQTDCTL